MSSISDSTLSSSLVQTSTSVESTPVAEVVEKNKPAMDKPALDKPALDKPVKGDRVKVPNQIILTDRWNNLEVYHYEDGTTDPALFEFRGIVKHGDTIVCKTFGYSPEVLVNDEAALEQQILPLLASNVTLYKSVEGTLLRLWCYEGEWHVSTHRKVDAFRSKWGHDTSSYGQLFLRAILPTVKKHAQPTSWADMEDSDSGSETTEDVLKTYCASLNPNKIYVFCLTTFKENRVVCNANADEPKLFCIGSFDRSNDFKFSLEVAETKVSTPENIPLDDTLTPEQKLALIKEKVNEMVPTEHQGVIVIANDGTNVKSAKVTNTENDRLMKLRGNMPNVVYRYVQLRWTPDIEEYKAMYPEHAEKFRQWEEKYEHIIHNILRKYIERYINGRTAILPPEQYKAMVDVHKLYMSTLRANKERVQLKHIDQVLGTWSERDVSVLVKEYNIRQKECGNGNRMTTSMRDGILQNVKLGQKKPRGNDTRRTPKSTENVRNAEDERTEASRPLQDFIQQ